METITTDRGNITVYHAPALAFLDSFGGMLPVSVLEVIRPGYGYVAAGPDSLTGEIRVRVNVSRGGYSRGEIITSKAHDVVPRDRRRPRGHINSDYMWS